MADIRHLDINETNKAVSTIDNAIASALGGISGSSIIQKFGRIESGSVVAGYKPACVGGIYRMPKTTGAIALRVKIGNVADVHTTGAGAREVTLQGLDETGAFAEEAIDTNGTSSGTASTTTWLRVFRAWVSKSGTYGDTGAVSQAADIIIETAGGVAWLTITKDDYGFSQSEIGMYTVPLGKKVVLLDYNITCATTKVVKFAFMKRESILDTAAPYQAIRLQFQGVGLNQPWKHSPQGGTVFNELTDIGFFAGATSASDISVDFTMLEMNN